MQLRLEITTPAGQALGTERKLRLFILGRLKKLPETYVDPNNDKFAWILDLDSRRRDKVIQRLAMFHTLTTQALDRVEEHKVMRKLGAVTKEDVDTLRAMFDKTTIRQVKNEEALQHDDEEPSWLEKVRGWWDRQK